MQATTAHLRHIGDIKTLTAKRAEISSMLKSTSFFHFGFFKKVADNFSRFFKKQSDIRTVHITNDKKARSGNTIYFINISSKELIYEEESDTLLRYVISFENDEVSTNTGTVYNQKTKQSLMKKLESVSDDIRNNDAFIFES